MNDSRAKIREALERLRVLEISEATHSHSPVSDVLYTEALALLDAEDKPERPKLNPEILVADIRQPGAPGKGAWKMSRKAAGDAVIIFVRNWAANGPKDKPSIPMEMLVAFAKHGSDSCRKDDYYDRETDLIEIAARYGYAVKE